MKIRFVILSLLPAMTGWGQLPFTYQVDSTSFNALTLEAGMTQARLADVNKDGHLDLVTIGDHGSPNVNTNQHGITVFFGNGTGTGWTLFQNGAFGYGGCAVGDLNNDGKQDVAYSMHHNYSSFDFGNQLIEAAIGDGTGMNWTPWDDGLAANGETYGMFGTDIGDVDNDGWLDIGSNSFGAGPGIHIYRNNANGTWTQSYQFGSGNTFHYIQFGDMDGDGNLDFVASNKSGSTFFGNGNGTFTLKKNGLPPLPDSNGYPYQDVSLADIDNDGDDDFIFTYKNYSANVCGLYVYAWNKGTQQWDNHSVGLPSSAGDKFYSARAADIDRDGFADIVVTSDLLNEVQIWKGNGGTSWSKIYSLAMSQFSGAEDIAIADIDHSGYPDILVWGSFLGGGPFNPVTQNKIRLFKDNVDPNTLTASLTYPKGNECWHSGSVKFINWISAVPGNHSSSVKIEYSSTGTAGPWTVITASAPNNGTYQWTVPAAVNSSACHIRVTATDNVTSATAVSMNSVPFNMGCTGSTTAVSEIPMLHNVTLYPSPFSAEATLHAGPGIEGARYVIYDLFGNKVRMGEIPSSAMLIPRGDLASGIYVLEVVKDNVSERLKFMIE